MLLVKLSDILDLFAAFPMELLLAHGALQLDYGTAKLFDFLALLPNPPNMPPN